MYCVAPQRLGDKGRLQASGLASATSAASGYRTGGRRTEDGAARWDAGRGARGGLRCLCVVLVSYVAVRGALSSSVFSVCGPGTDCTVPCPLQYY